MPNKTLVVIQARTGSRRLPRKVLMPLHGRTVLEHMVDRVRAAERVSDVVVATTTDANDDVLVELCKKVDVPYHRGHPLDLLERHLGAAEEFGADVVVKIPSDCPLIDPKVVSLVLGVHHGLKPDEVDFVTNLLPPTWPDGQDVEVMWTELLRRASREATRTVDREHTTPWFWDPPGRFKVINVRDPSGGERAKTHRWTLDYEEDYGFVQAVYDVLFDEKHHFSVEDVLQLLADRPEIAALNSRYLGDAWYERQSEQLSAKPTDAHAEAERAETEADEATD